MVYRSRSIQGKPTSGIEECRQYNEPLPVHMPVQVPTDHQVYIFYPGDVLPYVSGYGPDNCRRFHQGTGETVLDGRRQQPVDAFKNGPAVAVEEPESFIGLGEGMSMGKQDSLAAYGYDRLLGVDDIDTLYTGIPEEEIPVAGQDMDIGGLQCFNHRREMGFHPCIPVIEEITQDVHLIPDFTCTGQPGDKAADVVSCPGPEVDVGNKAKHKHHKGKTYLILQETSFITARNHGFGIQEGVLVPGGQEEEP